jgi:hypothetical protein
MLRERVSIVQFNASRPIILIFQLVVFAQHYVKMHNCLRFSSDQQRSTEKIKISRRNLITFDAAANKHFTSNKSRNYSGVRKSSDQTIRRIASSSDSRRRLKRAWWKGKMKKLFFK